MKIDAFIQLMSNIRKGQLTDDTDPNNTVIQQYTSPYDTMTVSEALEISVKKSLSFVWGDGTTYTATDTAGNPYQAPSCGWEWSSGGRYS